MIRPVDPAAAERYMRVPFVPRGRGLAGWDCWGLVMTVARLQAGVAMPDYAASPSDAAGVAREFAAGLADVDCWIAVDPRDARPLDVCVMRATATVDGRTRRLPFHAGLFLDGRRLLHAEKGLGTLCLTTASAEYRRRTVCIRRFRGLA